MRRAEKIVSLDGMGTTCRGFYRSSKGNEYAGTKASLPIARGLTWQGHIKAERAKLREIGNEQAAEEEKDDHGAAKTARAAGNIEGGGSAASTQSTLLCQGQFIAARSDGAISLVWNLRILQMFHVKQLATPDKTGIC